MTQTAAGQPIENLVGQVLGDRYELVRLLGEGGMGQVYEARHIHIEKRVALKLLRAEILSNPEAVTRFRQEARSASSIGHENIIQIDDFGSLPDGRVYLTMEFLGGAALSDLLKNGPLPLSQALDIVIQTCRGLAAAHAKGIVHRDMKPENIYVVPTPDGRSLAKLLDFGIAKVSQGDNNATLTRTGAIFGTPYYMSPEQALGQPVDHRADVYALGVILFEIFTGVVPFQGDSFMGILTQHITAQAPSPIETARSRGRDMPPELDALIQKAMAKDPAQRHQDMASLVDELTAIYRARVGAGATAPPPSPVRTQAWGALSGQSGMGRSATPIPAPMSAPSGRAATPTPQATEGFTLEPARKSRAPWIALVIVILGGGGAGYYFAGRDGGAAQAGVGAGVDAAVATPVRDAAVAIDAAVAARPAVDSGSGPAPGAAAVADAVAVLIDSLPRGAEIWRGEELLGVTPGMVEVIPGTPVTVQLKRSRHEDIDVVLDGTNRRVVTKLQELAGTERPTRKPPPTKPPATKPPETKSPTKPPTQTKPPRGDSGLVDDYNELE